jgi:hypothetical protein
VCFWPAGNLDELQDPPLQVLRYNVEWSSTLAPSAGSCACVPAAPATASSTEGHWSRPVLTEAMQPLPTVGALFASSDSVLSTCSMRTHYTPKSSMHAPCMVVLSTSAATTAQSVERHGRPLDATFRAVWGNATPCLALVWAPFLQVTMDHAGPAPELDANIGRSGCRDRTVGCKHGRNESSCAADSSSQVCVNEITPMVDLACAGMQTGSSWYDGMQAG